MLAASGAGGMKRNSTIAACLMRTSDLLVPITDTPRFEAELLLAYTLGLSRAALLARLSEPVDMSCIEPLLARRLNHEPLAYIFGEWEFFGLPFFVEPPLLVPRPETEHLVETALKFVAAYAPALNSPCHIADICCGTGCVAIVLGHYLKGHHLYACDIRADAVAMTQRNAVRHHVPLHTVQGNLLDPFNALGDSFDVIISNPPYVPEGEWDDLSPVITKHEDPKALLAGSDGLDLIRHIIPEAWRRLRNGGLLALELGEGQGAAVAELLRKEGFDSIEMIRDLAGIERIISAVRNE